MTDQIKDVCCEKPVTNVLLLFFFVFTYISFIAYVMFPSSGVGILAFALFVYTIVVCGFKYRYQRDNLDKLRQNYDVICTLTSVTIVVLLMFMFTVLIVIVIQEVYEVNMLTAG